MDYLRGMCGVKRIDRVRNDEVRRRCGVSRSVITELDRAQLRWYGHIERMPGTRYTKQIYQGEVVGTRPIGRPKKSWLEGVQDVLNRHRIKTSINKRAVQAKVMKLRDAQVECQDRARWRKVCSDLQ
jgi:hypothetical protein